MTYHPCPRCKRLIPAGVQYCDACRPVAEAQAAEAVERKRAYREASYNKKYNKRRDPKYLTFYRSKDWRTLSRAYMSAVDYKCEARLDGCTRIAVDVHHRQPIQTPEGWDRRIEWENLEAVCVNCHNKRHGGRYKRKNEIGVIDLKQLER